MASFGHNILFSTQTLPSAVATFVPSAVGKIFGNHCPSWGFSEGLIMNNYMFSNNHVWHSEHGPDPLYELQKGQFPRPGLAANVSMPVFWLPNCSDGGEFETLGREGSGTFVGVWNTICQPLSVCGESPSSYAVLVTCWTPLFSPEAKRRHYSTLHLW